MHYPACVRFARSRTTKPLAGEEGQPSAMTTATARRRLETAALAAVWLSGRGGDAATSTSPGDASADAAASLVPPVVVPGCHDGFCLVKPGTYVMGSPPDEPERSRFGEEQWPVTLTHDVLFGQHEVTQAEWAAMGLPPVSARHQVGGYWNCQAPNCPADEINWSMAVEYLNHRSRAEGLQECIVLEKCHGTIGTDYFCDDYEQTTPSYYDCLGYRLPTSAEWQYAARAGTTTTFYSGPWNPVQGHETECTDIPHLSATAWYCANAGDLVHPVMTRTPNPWGLFDMIGNVGEMIANRGPLDMRGWGAHTDPFADTKSPPNLDPRGGFVSLVDVGPWLLRLAIPPLTASNAQAAVAAPLIGLRSVRTITHDQAARW
jgi:formylglycine-generating enzyme required for sulfatase activity